MRRRLPPLGPLAILALLGSPGPGGAQAHGDGAVAARPWSLGAQAVGLVTAADPAFDGRRFVEGYVTQPMLMGRLAAPRLGLALHGTLSFEGVTLRRGELNAGTYGEGYVDRRHPHTLVHELMASVGGGVGAGAWSLAAGKGFVPFGTDDPMSRPFVKFPVNHHLAQLLERLVVAGGVRVGPAVLEGAAFNGDEPTGPYAWPLARRFGDSWAARATAHVASGVELQASLADVTSPEHRAGGGLDQRKASLSARLERGGAYVLLEAARTDDRSGDRRAFRYESALGEGALRRGPWTAALRLERTTRPEEERLLDPFRTPRPHGELSIIGLTRWDVATLALSRQVEARPGLVLRPLAEVGWAHATPRVRPALFEPRGFYGAAGQWSLSVGVRASLGALHARMGRYGVAAAHPAGGATHPAGHDGGHPPPANAPPAPGYSPPP